MLNQLWLSSFQSRINSCFVEDVMCSWEVLKFCEKDISSLY
jgi:hypothetical protein